MVPAHGPERVTRVMPLATLAADLAIFSVFQWFFKEECNPE